MLCKLKAPEKIMMFIFMTKKWLFLTRVLLEESLDFFSRKLEEKEKKEGS